MRDWLAVGFLLMVGMVIVPLLAEFKSLNAVYGTGYIVPFSLVLGLVITLYAGFFIASHIDLFARLLYGRGRSR